MILAPAVDAWLDELRPTSDPVERDIEEHARRERVPVVESGAGALLGVLARAAGARRVVEIGTAIGLSTLQLARAVGEGGEVVSFDVDPSRQDAARGYLERAGVAGRVDLRLEDAREGLRRLDGPFDLVFVDGVKAQYPAYVEAALPLLRRGALLIVDNMLMSGAVAAGRGDGHWSDEAVAGMRDFTRRLLERPELTATVLPVGDGVAVCVRE